MKRKRAPSDYAAVLISGQWRACVRGGRQWDEADFRYSAGPGRLSARRAVAMAAKFQAFRDEHPTERELLDCTSCTSRGPDNGWEVKRGDVGKDSRMRHISLSPAGEYLEWEPHPTTQIRVPGLFAEVFRVKAARLGVTPGEACAQIVLRGLESYGPEEHDSILLEASAEIMGRAER